MTLEQIALQLVAPFDRLFAWRGSATEYAHICWQLRDMTTGYAIGGLTSRSFLLDVNKAQYVTGIISNLDESNPRAAYQGNNYAANGWDDWECGTKEEFAKWLCAELKVPYDS